MWLIGWLLVMCVSVCFGMFVCLVVFVLVVCVFCSFNVVWRVNVFTLLCV